MNNNLPEPTNGDPYEENDSTYTATPISVTGTISDATIHVESDRDYYKLTPSESGHLSYHVISPTGTSYRTQLLNHYGVPHGDPGNADLVSGLTYYLIVSTDSGYSSENPYTLSLGLVEEPTVTVSQSTFMPLDINSGPLQVAHRYNPEYTYRYFVFSDSMPRTEIANMLAGSNGQLTWDGWYQEPGTGRTYPAMEGLVYIEVEAI